MRRRMIRSLACIPLGMAWGALAGLVAGAVYGAVLTLGAGFFFGGLYGLVGGAGLGTFVGLCVALCTAVRPPKSRQGFVSLVRWFSTGVPFAIAVLVLAVTGDGESSTGYMFFLTGPLFIASIVGWFLAPRAARPLLHGLLDRGPDAELRAHS